MQPIGPTIWCVEKRVRHKTADKTTLFSWALHLWKTPKSLSLCMWKTVDLVLHTGCPLARLWYEQQIGNRACLARLIGGRLVSTSHYSPSGGLVFAVPATPMATPTSSVSIRVRACRSCGLAHLYVSASCYSPSTTISTTPSPSLFTWACCCCSSPPFLTPTR